MNNTKQETDNSVINYILLFFLIAVSGIPYFYTSDLLLVIGVLFSFFVFWKKNNKFNIPSLGVIAAFVFVEFSQAINFQAFELRTMAGTLTRLFLAYFVIATLGSKFFRLYPKIIYHLAVVGLLIYGITLIPGIGDFLLNSISPIFVSPFDESGQFYKAHRTMLVYNLEHVESLRNSGPFWEPGAYAIFLIFAQILRYDGRNFFDKQGIILFVSVITTFSTSGYIGEFLFLMMILLNKRSLLSKIAIPVLLVAGFFIYSEVDFLERKIEQNIIVADYNTSSRFGSAVADFYDFIESPIIGYGRGEQRYAGRKYVSFSAEFHRNNGLSDLFVTYGFFLSLLYFYFYYKSLNSISTYNSVSNVFALYFLVLVLLLGFSQGIFLRPFFMSFLFLGHMIPVGEKASNKS